jgi:hypothetical protein
MKMLEKLSLKGGRGELVPKTKENFPSVSASEVAL